MGLHTCTAVARSLCVSWAFLYKLVSRRLLGVVGSLVLVLMPVKHFWKSVENWRSYWYEFFGTRFVWCCASGLIDAVSWIFSLCLLAHCIGAHLITTVPVFAPCVLNQCVSVYVQGDHLSGKPGNVREFETCQGNVRDVVNSQGIVREKILSGKNTLTCTHFMQID